MIGVGSFSPASVGSPLPFGSGSRPSSEASAVATASGLWAEPLATLSNGPARPFGSKRTVKVMVAVAPTASVSVPASRFGSALPSNPALTVSVPEAGASYNFV